MTTKYTVIVGAGPAGLTAAYELLQRTDIKPIVFEMSGDIGGISKTVRYKGNRMDIGGHRFFSKSDRVTEWWEKILPLQGSGRWDERIPGGQREGLGNESARLMSGGPDPATCDRVMLIRRRISRIFFLRKFFDYPLALSMQTIASLGLLRLMKIGISYFQAQIRPVKPEKTLEHFFINRFGKELYRTFFKDYTEKVWGMPCRALDASWGAQRVKGLNIVKAVQHAARKILFFKDDSLEQKKTETSLIERFMYPKYGPGQLWETVADLIREKGGEVILNHQATGIRCEDDKVVAIEVTNLLTGEKKEIQGDYFISTMPVQELVLNMRGVEVPTEVVNVARDLAYRDFMTVGLLLDKFKVKNNTKIKTVNNLIPDNWIYIQERDVKVGRVQVFNNWSPYLVQDPKKVWIGLEYFCNEGDSLWSKTDDEFKRFAVAELVKIGFIYETDVLDHVVVRMKKVYPAYCGSFARFDFVKNYLNQFGNLFLVGRNGMHRYNNADHSMLTAMTAVDNILAGIKTKDNIWAVNTEQEYHEEKK